MFACLIQLTSHLHSFSLFTLLWIAIIQTHTYDVHRTCVLGQPSNCMPMNGGLAAYYQSAATATSMATNSAAAANGGLRRGLANTMLEHSASPLPPPTYDIATNNKLLSNEFRRTQSARFQQVAQQQQQVRLPRLLSQRFTNCLIDCLHLQSQITTTSTASATILVSRSSMQISKWPPACRRLAMVWWCRRKDRWRWLATISPMSTTMARWCTRLLVALPLPLLREQCTILLMAVATTKTITKLITQDCRFSRKRTAHRRTPRHRPRYRPRRPPTATSTPPTAPAMAATLSTLPICCITTIVPMLCVKARRLIFSAWKTLRLWRAMPPLLLLLAMPVVKTMLITLIPRAPCSPTAATCTGRARRRSCPEVLVSTRSWSSTTRPRRPASVECPHLLKSMIILLFFLFCFSRQPS